MTVLHSKVRWWLIDVLFSGGLTSFSRLHNMRHHDGMLDIRWLLGVLIWFTGLPLDAFCGILESGSRERLVISFFLYIELTFTFHLPTSSTIAFDSTWLCFLPWEWCVPEIGNEAHEHLCGFTSAQRSCYMCTAYWWHDRSKKTNLILLGYQLMLVYMWLTVNTSWFIKFALIRFRWDKRASSKRLYVCSWCFANVTTIELALTRVQFNSKVACRFVKRCAVFCCWPIFLSCILI